MEHEFLSTPSARRATRSLALAFRSPRNFYPRPPRGGRPRLRVLDPFVLEISIHALREEGDDDPADDRIPIVVISIHALREEGDATGIPSSKVLRDFYPRPPRGGRPRQRQQQTEHGKFLSTPSARRATILSSAPRAVDWISIHALREEGDSGTVANYSKTKAISIHALREEGDLPWLSLCSAIGKFLSTPSARRATDAPLIWATSLMYFYPRPLRGGRQPSVSAPGCNYIFLSTPSARRATGESCHRGCRRDISIHALCEEGDA